MLFTTLSFLACTPAMMALQRENLDKGHLGEGVDIYWKAARWGDVATLSSLMVRPEDQLAVARVLASPTLRVTDVRVLQVVVGPELIARRDRDRTDVNQRWREGTALVQVEVYALATDRVESTTEEQKWVMDVRGWHVDTEASPIDADRPW
ncbi:hypothetical protein LBMAG42_33420 [Deltaproteobacteria bacterium]|nr:hypothetical protein LBMAG42_33420 [Deltaproteobacteria bacterium]